MSHGPVIEQALAREVDGDVRLWALYDSAFPAEEREPRSVISKGLESGVVDVLRARGRDGTVGFAMVHRLLDPAAAFLVYLAVAKEARGVGLGRSLFLRVAESSPRGVVFEIELPALSRDAAERRIRERRLDFFERLGAQVVSTAYLQPAINGPEPVPMALMASGALISMPVETLVSALYFQKYAPMNGLDRELLVAVRGRHVAK